MTQDDPRREPGVVLFWKRPLAVFGAALAVRLAVAWEAWAKVPFLRAPVVDGAEYLNRAKQVAAGQLWADTMQIHPPLYGWFLGAVLALFGEGSFAPFAAQAAIGAGTCVLVWAWTRALAGERAALLAGLLAAFAWPLVFQEAYFSATALVVFLLAGALASAAWAIDGKPSRALLPGLLVGLAGIAHGLALGFVLVLLVPLRERTRRGALAAALALSAAAIPPLAVCLHNASLDDGHFGLQANVGLNLWIGNGDAADGYPSVVQGPAYDDLVHDAWISGAMTAKEQDAWFRRRVARRIADAPLDWAGLLVLKAARTAAARDVDSSIDSGLFRRLLVTDALAFVRWGWVFGLGIAGLVLVARQPRHRALAFAALFAATIPLVLLVTSARYRVPLLLVLLPCAGVALSAAWDLRRELLSRRGLALALPAVLAAAASYLLSPSMPSDRYFPNDRFLAASLTSLKRFPEAERHVLAARRADTNDPSLPLMQSKIYLAAGRPEAAAAPLREALAIDPSYLDALEQAARLLPVAETEAAFARAAEADPRDPRIPARLGEWRLSRDRAGEAVEPLARAVAMQPRSRSFRINLGDALLASGRAAEAEVQYRAVFDADPLHPAALYGLGACALARGAFEDAKLWAARAQEAGHPGAPDLLESAWGP